MSIRQGILDAVRTRLGRIRKANGYRTDIGANVLEWQTAPVPSADLPAISFRDAENEIAEWTMRERDNRVAVVIEAFGRDVPPSTVRQYVEDIYAAIAVDETWGGLALVTEPVSDEIEFRTAEEGVGRATVRILIEYQTAKWEF